MPPGTRRQIWVIDDSPLDAGRAERALSTNAEIRVFTDGAAALEALGNAERLPDALVLDWMMPGVTGLEICRFIRRSTGALVQLPVLLLTAQHEPEQVAEALAAGANDFLAKPWAEVELRARVDAMVRAGRLLERAEGAELTIRQLLAASPDALLALDMEERVTYANAESERVFFRPASELVGLRVYELLPAHALDHLRAARTESKVSLPDVVIGDGVYAPMVQVPPHGAGGTIIVALRDVTKRRRAESRRLDFYSILAHDLRSPMSAILLRGDMLLRRKGETLPADVVTHLQRTHGNIASLMAMINDFLDLARFEGTAFQLDREPLDLGQLVQATAEDLRPLAEAQQISLEMKPPTEAYVVLGDRPRLVQVLANLIGNAIKFTPSRGRITLQITTSGGLVEVSVSDTGPGIPAEALPTIFERYIRAPGAAAPGSGLGLMIVREIVDAHGGSVGVGSTPGQGSRFWFSLPRADRPVPARAEMAQA